MTDRPPAGRTLDAHLHLLDRQVLDRDRVPIVVVDDVEIGGIVLGEPIAVGAPAPTITALLSGPVLVTRIFGGRPPDSRLHPIDWRHVAEVGTAIVLGVDGNALDVAWTERWVRDHIIGRIPGGRHDPE
jgi:hypothetical protein